MSNIALQRRTIELGTTSYDYILRRSLRTHHVRLAVSLNGGLSVSAPYWVRSSLIEQFLLRHADWIGEQVRIFRQRGVPLLTQGGAREYAQHKESARVLATRRLAYFNTQYNFVYGKISVRNQKTRWGSCSRSGNLSFNYRIALIPPALADYVILHELCHIGVFDHSARFWTLVEQAMPDYQERRRAMRQLKI